MTYLFLAIDGVVHPRIEGATPGALLHMDRLVSVLAAYSDVSVVIIDPMRETTSLDVIKELFPIEIHHRIVGATATFKQKCDSGGQQIMHYGLLGTDSSKVVLDFDRSRYSHRIFIEAYVAFTDPSIGLNRQSEMRLRILLNASRPAALESVRANWLTAYKFATGRDDDQQYSATKWISHWQPKVVVLCAQTLELERAVQSGALARNLFRGLSRVYVHEMALIRRPKLRSIIDQQQRQFPYRLMAFPLQDAFDHHLFATYEKTKNIAGVEQTYIGINLRNAYAADVKVGMSEAEVVLSLGMLVNKKWFSYGWPVSQQTFDCITSETVSNLKDAFSNHQENSEKRAIEALGNAFKKDD